MQIALTTNFKLKIIFSFFPYTYDNNINLTNTFKFNFKIYKQLSFEFLENLVSFLMKIIYNTFNYIFA